MRKALEAVGGQIDLADQVFQPRAELGFVRRVVDANRVCDLVEDSAPWVHRGVRVLEDDLHLGAHFAQFARLERGQFGAVKRHGSRDRLDQSQDRPCQRRLSGPTFAHKGQRLSGRDIEGGHVDGMHLCSLATQQARPHREPRDKVADFDQQFLLVLLFRILRP